MDGQGLRMCRFTRDGIPELGEYLESVDGTGICKLTELDGGGEEVVVCLPDGTMPEGISDLELVRVPTRIEEGDAKTETMSDETAERMARTRFIEMRHLLQCGNGDLRFHLGQRGGEGHDPVLRQMPEIRDAKHLQNLFLGQLTAHHARS